MISETTKELILYGVIIIVTAILVCIWVIYEMRKTTEEIKKEIESEKIRNAKEDQQYQLDKSAKSGAMKAELLTNQERLKETKEAVSEALSRYREKNKEYEQKTDRTLPRTRAQIYAEKLSKYLKLDEQQEQLLMLRVKRLKEEELVKTSDSVMYEDQWVLDEITHITVHTTTGLTMKIQKDNIAYGWYKFLLTHDKKVSANVKHCAEQRINLANAANNEPVKDQGKTSKPSVGYIIEPHLVAIESMRTIAKNHEKEFMDACSLIGLCDGKPTQARARSRNPKEKTRWEETYGVTEGDSNEN